MTFRSKYCEGETCICGHPADYKVEETIFDDDPYPHRHPLTSYLCRDCFADIMGTYLK